MDSKEAFLAPDLVSGVREIAAVFESRKVAHALIGGVAVSYRSRPRSTRDIDFMVQVPQLALSALLDDLLQRGFEFDLNTVIRQYVQEHMTVLSYRGIRVDWLKPMLPIYQHVIDRAGKEEWLGTQVKVASPESLIVMKLLAFRAQDQIDLTNLLAANPGQLDLSFVRQEWLTVGEADDPRMLRFEQMVEQYYNPPAS
jgi:predicted nucleotidyltransferase